MEAWSRTRNPWIILQDISAERLRVLAADGSFVAEIERLARTRQAYLEAPSWFSSAHGTAALSGVAYFSMEFGLGRGCLFTPEGSASSPAITSKRRAIWGYR